MSSNRGRRWLHVQTCILQWSQNEAGRPVTAHSQIFNTIRLPFSAQFVPDGELGTQRDRPRGLRLLSSVTAAYDPASAKSREVCGDTIEYSEPARHDEAKRPRLAFFVVPAPVCSTHGAMAKSE